MMFTYISFNKFTSKGLDEIQETVKRSEDAAKLAKSMNVEMKTIYWCSGPYDNVVIFEAEKESDMLAFMLAIKKLGFITVESSRAFTKSEMSDALGSLGQLQQRMGATQ